jgi:hypothetical protein
MINILESAAKSCRYIVVLRCFTKLVCAVLLKANTRMKHSYKIVVGLTKMSADSLAVCLHLLLTLV